MPAHEAAHLLVGLELEGGWRVVEMLPRGGTATGGNFSVGYIVESPSGQRAYLKALDYSAALKAADIPRALQDAVRFFNHERDLVHKCEMARLSRIVRALSDGVVQVDGAVGGIPQVNYLIFELADGDVRGALGTAANRTLGWKLSALHHVATGLAQLHRHGMAHQDVKPSNVLIFEGTSAKIADLGRASYQRGESPFDGMPVIGDLTYAPPELLYRYPALDWEHKCQACDAYLLGSFARFLFTGVGTTAAIMQRLPPDYRWRAWRGSYSQVLPYVRDAFDEAMEEFSALLHPAIRDELVVRVGELCDPDPEVRGHPLSRAARGSSYALERYVSRFDYLSRTIRIARLDGELA